MLEHNDWLTDRLRTRKETTAATRLQMQWLANARASYDAMVENLRASVQGCVEKYNQMFEDECHAGFRTVSDDSFSVSCAGQILTVYKNSGTTISFEITSSTVRETPRFGSLEVAADAEDGGKVGYKYGEEFLDVTKAAQAILDDVLCK
jgi:hypothetical protein